MKKMFLVLVEAEADGTKPPYRVGDIHPILLYMLRDDHPTKEECLGILAPNGWNSVELHKSGIISRKSVEKEELEYYDHAAKNGTAIVVYSDPRDPGPRH